MCHLTNQWLLFPRQLWEKTICFCSLDTSATEFQSKHSASSLVNEFTGECRWEALSTKSFYRFQSLLKTLKTRLIWQLFSRSLIPDDELAWIRSSNESLKSSQLKWNRVCTNWWKVLDENEAIKRRPTRRILTKSSMNKKSEISIGSLMIR